MLHIENADEAFAHHIALAENTRRSLLLRWEDSFKAEDAARAASFCGDTEEAFARIIDVREAMHAALKGTR